MYSANMSAWGGGRSGGGRGCSEIRSQPDHCPSPRALQCNVYIKCLSCTLADIALRHLFAVCHLARPGAIHANVIHAHIMSPAHHAQIKASNIDRHGHSAGVLFAACILVTIRPAPPPRHAQRNPPTTAFRTHELYPHVLNKRSRLCNAVSPQAVRSM